jgi:hypothetical protein
LKQSALTRQILYLLKVKDVESLILLKGQDLIWQLSRMKIKVAAGAVVTGAALSRALASSPGKWWSSWAKTLNGFSK